MIHDSNISLGYSCYFEVATIFFSRNFSCREGFGNIHLVNYGAWWENLATCWPCWEFLRRAEEDESYLVGLEHFKRDVHYLCNYFLLYFLAILFLALRTIRKCDFALYQSFLKTSLLAFCSLLGGLRNAYCFLKHLNENDDTFFLTNSSLETSSSEFFLLGLPRLATLLLLIINQII